MFSEDRPVGNPAQIFRSFLKNKGLRNTPQRQQIMEVFFNESGHLTTEEIYDRVRKEDPSLGQATVYRTMKLLCEAGLAREVRFGDGLARYEHAADAHHDHLICENCGRNIEVVDSQIEELQDALARKHGFKPTFHRGSFGLLVFPFPRAESLMRSRDLVMIVVSFLAMLAGSFLPGLAEPLAPFPRLCLIVLLYLGFLSVGTEALFIHTRLIPGTISGLVLIRLFALPLLSFFLFKLLMPQFALGALLVGAASIGVVAPIFSIMVNADTALVLAGNLLSSLLLPLTLPMLLYIVDSFMTLSGFGPMNLPAHLSLSGMTLSLCVTIIVPFAGAFLTRKAPRVTEYILKHQFPVSVSTIALSTLAIFSNYSGVLHQSPSLVVKALGAACLLGVVMMVGGLFLPRSMPPQRKLAFLISYGTMNNVLMLIVSLEFFSASESIMAAMYLLPLNALLVYYRALSRSWGLEQAAG